MTPERNDTSAAVVIRRWQDVGGSATAIVAQLDGIFFEASNTKSFSSDEARAAFRERWFGRYLERYPQWAYVAQTVDGTVAGYLVGALDEPTAMEDFASAAQAFPAHLHVNLAPQFRSRGIGADLIEAFLEDAQQAGVKGVHVVTSADARNVGFYERVGFKPRATTIVNGAELVFLGRAL